MKKILFSLLLTGLLTAACSESSFDENVDQKNKNGSSLQGYLTINMATPGSVTSRADYLDGTSKENYINLVRFYFFDNSGNAVLVSEDPYNEDSYCSFIDWLPSQQDNNNASGDADATVEKILSTTLELIKPDNYSIRPTIVMAVVNPPQEILNLGNASKADLTQYVSDFCTGYTDNNFVMTNSVYVDNDGTVLDYTPIASASLATSLLAANANPVTIYVERVVSRLDLSFVGADVIPVDGQDNVYSTNVTYEPLDDPAISENVNVKFLGWTVTATPTTSRLVKAVDSQWPANMFATGNPWNSDDFHRSFWAINPEEVEYQWYSHNELSGATAYTGFGGPLTMTQGTIYVHENANPYYNTIGANANPTYPSQVIVAAQLVDDDGNPLTIAEYNRQHYTVDGLKNFVASNLNLYTKNVSGVYQRITPQQLTFITSTQWKGEAGPGVGGSYFVYFVLTPEAESLVWYTSSSYGQSDTDDYRYIETSAVNQYIYEVANRALIWNNGATYYYLNVQHLGALASTGYYGMVRNHIYNTIVTKIDGLGTPVYDPSETIYPEEVDVNGSLLRAQVQILQWRIVNGGYEFSW